MIEYYLRFFEGGTNLKALREETKSFLKSSSIMYQFRTRGYIEKRGSLWFLTNAGWWCWMRYLSCK